MSVSDFFVRAGFLKWEQQTKSKSNCLVEEKLFANEVNASLKEESSRAGKSLYCRLVIRLKSHQLDVAVILI